MQESISLSGRQGPEATAAGVEREISEHALPESHRRLAAIFDCAAGGIAVCDLDGKFTMVNDRYCAIVGRPREQLLQTHVQEITHPDDLPGNVARLRRLIDDGKAFTIEKRYLRPDGASIWTRNEVSAIKDDAGAPVLLLAICQDITEAKRSEQLLAEQLSLLAFTASGHPLHACLSALCDAVSRLAPRVRSCVLVADAAGAAFTRAVVTDLPASFSAGLAGAPIDDRTIGTCGEAVRRGRAVSCSDVAGDMRWSETWRAHCLEHGVRACYSRPVLAADGAPIASFLLTFDEAREPTRWERRLATFGAHIASIAIERERIDRSLRASELRYRSLFASIDDGLCVIEVVSGDEGRTIELRFVEANRAFASYATRARGAAIGRSIAMSDLDPAWIAACRDVAREGTAVRFEHRAVASHAWFEVHAFPFGKPENGNVAVLLRDITARKSAEVRDRFMLNLSEILRPLTDPRAVKAEAARVLGQHLHANRVVYADFNDGQAHAQFDDGFAENVSMLEGRHRLAEFDPAALVALRAGRTYIHCDLADDPKLTASQKAAYARLGVRSAIVAPLVKGGRLVGALAVHQGTPRGWHPDEIALVEDTAQRTWHAVERGRAERALRESEAKFRDLADNISQCAWMADPDGSVFWYNRRWFEYTGSTLENACGGGWTKFVHPEHLPAVLERMRKSMDRGDPWEDSFPIRASDGGYRWFLSRAMPIRDAKQKVVRWFGTSTDIDDQRAAEQALRDADRRKDEFLATLGHELRAPLAPIRNAVHILRAGAATPEQMQTAREMIDRQVHHLVRLIDDLLDLGRITADKIRLRSERVELASIVSQAIEAVRSDLDAAGHRLSVELPRPGVYLNADPTRLVQVFGNLLSNACKYTPAGGSIRVSAETSHVAERPMVTVRVVDDGIGMPADFIPKLFERFSQAQSALERAQGGLGIGLSLVRRLVQMHGGTVSGRSDGPGLGSEFIVRLPVLDTVASSPALVPDGEAARTSRRALVVDDNHDNAESLATLLRLHGDEVEVAHDGLQALAIAERQRPDVVLLDIGMPGLNGYDTCRVLRTQTWGKEMLVIAQTGWGQNEDRRRAQQAGFDGHLVKPIDHSALARMLTSLQAQRRERAMHQG